MSPIRAATRVLPPLLLVVAALLAWQAATVLLHVPEFLLPSPADVWATAVSEHSLLLENTVPTFEVAVLGFLLALVIGVGLAVLIRFSHAVELALYPIVIASQTVPILALAPILVVLMGFTILPKLVVVCLVCLFPLTINTLDGFRSVDPGHGAMLRAMGAGRWRVFRYVEVPSALPLLFSGAKVAITYSVVGAIFAEWVGSSEGLGYVIIQAKAQFDTAAVFAAMGILTAMGAFLFGAVAVAERILLPWHQDARPATRTSHFGDRP